ncbi:E3 binding domain-containing protein, partial [Pelagibacterales bacterium SAG-MED43]|nr:E3 binding domain-containing protein [Pelagibacterales bacterium SAG-MED43]
MHQKQLKNIKLISINRCQQNCKMTIKNYLSLVSASPKVRKFARELGVDINKISGSERRGRVTEKDIKLFVSTKSY